MRIHVDKIPPEGLEIAGEIDSHTMSLDMEDQGIALTGSISVKAKVIKAGGEVFADISLEVPAEYTCGRCLAKFAGVLKKEFKTSYDVQPGEIIEMDEDIRQETILDCPMKSLCKPDCKGLCQNCGQNLNVDTCECPDEDKKEGKTKNIGLDL
ncbi:MAG: DUF177 domain-containing protein [Candidatus Omnitrophica bacterium]|nr:DUF177 domain-containing protein [Candidatus Omnitrophota bacterium]MBU1932876.1 DUF177 domain-containing protein [Candidatus Omnitrophota bacterium]